VYFVYNDAYLEREHEKMSDIQLYLFEVDKNKTEAKAVAERSARKLESKELKLIALITSLEEYINNKDDAAVRAKSVAYLADVLDALPSGVLSGQERRLLIDFILGRIEGDVEGIGSSARALLALERLGKWDSVTAAKVMSTFLDHANPLKQFKLQSERYYSSSISCLPNIEQQSKLYTMMIPRSCPVSSHTSMARKIQGTS
jgi:DNA repair/transcription protein MET18/MMS19